MALSGRKSSLVQTFCEACGHLDIPISEICDSRLSYLNQSTETGKMFLFTHTEPTLKALLNELHPVRDSWFKIGLELDIPHTELICFRKRHSDFSDAMCEMLIHWLKTNVNPPPTWEAVVIALRSPLVNEMNVATQLELKYCPSMQHMMDESTSQPTRTEKSEGTISKLLCYLH